MSKWVYLVDQLGLANEHIKQLQEQAEKIRKELFEMHPGDSKLSGATFELEMLEYDRDTLNGRKLAELTGATSEQIHKATTTSHIVSMKTTRIA